jgi:hypothetical protein
MKPTLHIKPFFFFLIFAFCLLPSAFPLREILVDPRKTDFKVSDHFSDISYIKLESSKDCYLRYPAEIIFDNGILFIQDLEVYAFDLNGKFLNTFGRIGKGPSEYPMLTDFWVDVHGKAVEILAGTLIKRFNYAGQFIEQETGLIANSFGKTRNGDYLYFNDYRPVLAKGDDHLRTDHLIILADKKGNIISDLSDQVDYFGKYPAGGTPTRIASYQDSLVLVIERNSSVYQLEGTTLRQKYHITFIPNSLPDHLPKNHQDFTQQEYSAYKKGNIHTINAFRESSKLGSFWFMYDQAPTYCLFFKQSGKAYPFNPKTIRNDRNHLAFGTILNLDDNYVTTSLDATDLIDQLEENLKSLDEAGKKRFTQANPALMEIYQKTQRDDNPILIRYRIK